MAKQEITLKGLDGQEDHLVYDAANGQVGDSLEECARSLFPQEGETTPRLRFQGFEGEWKKAKLGDLFTERVENDINGEMLSVTMNQGIIKASENGRFDNSNSDKSHYKVVKVNDIAYNSMRMWQGASGCSPYDGIVSPAYTVVTPVEGIDPHFFACLFKTPSVIKLFRLSSQGLTTDTWNLKYPAFSKISVSYPQDIEEQKAIASFFRRLDTQIALRKNQYERLQQMKAACLDSMFPRDTEIAPPIRFRGFDGEWEKQKASKLFMTFNERNRPDLPVLSACQDIRGMAVRSESGYDISHDRSNEVTYKVVKPGQFVIHLRSFQGGFAHSAVEGITSPAYTVFGFKEPSLHDDYFWKTIFMSKSFVKSLETITYGIRDGRSISFEEFSNMVFSFPSNDEQHAIASFFKGINSRISTEQEQLERLKQMKSACLRSMFPQNGGGNFRPLIRFYGFNEEWITICFAELFTFLKNNSLSRADLGAKGRVKNVHYGDVLIKFGEVINMNREELPYITNETVADSLAANCQLRDGDVVFADAAEDNTVGKCAEIASIGNMVVVSGLHTIPCRPNRIFSEGFLGYCLNANAFHDQLLPLIQGTKISSISKKALASTYITFPRSMDEQRCIASFFRSLDTKISLQTLRIEKLKQMKSACLSRMIA